MDDARRWQPGVLIESGRSDDRSPGMEGPGSLLRLRLRSDAVAPGPALLTQECPPAPGLQDIVRSHALTVARSLGPMSFKPLAARAEVFMQFALQGRYGIVYGSSGEVHTRPPVIVVGPQTRRHGDLRIVGTVVTCTIHFRPAGFYRLFRVPMADLADRWWDAEAVIGPRVRELREQLQAAAGLPAMAALLDTFLLGRLAQSQPVHQVQAAARALAACHGALRIDMLAASSQLSRRQFERHFTQQVGVVPKLFARLARFRRVLALHDADPTCHWSDIAAEAGYYDQMHLIHDCRTFAGLTPSVLVRAAGQHQRVDVFGPHAAGACAVPPDAPVTRRPPR